MKRRQREEKGSPGREETSWDTQYECFTTAVNNNKCKEVSESKYVNVRFQKEKECEKYCYFFHPNTDDASLRVEKFLSTGSFFSQGGVNKGQLKVYIDFKRREKKEVKKNEYIFQILWTYGRSQKRNRWYGQHRDDNKELDMRFNNPEFSDGVLIELEGQPIHREIFHGRYYLPWDGKLTIFFGNRQNFFSFSNMMFIVDKTTIEICSSTNLDRAYLLVSSTGEHIISEELAFGKRHDNRPPPRIYNRWLYPELKKALEYLNLFIFDVKRRKTVHQ